MVVLNYDTMGKEELREEFRGREMSYSKLTVPQMRDALRQNDVDLAAMLADEDEFEMSSEELEQQALRPKSDEAPTVVLSEADKGQIAAEAAARKPAGRAGVKIEKDREERNGIKRPSLGGVCRAVWDFCDAHREVVDAKLIRTEAAHSGWNPNNAMIEFYQWRKFNGISGRKAK
jgi:hypothetical protein